MQRVAKKSRVELSAFESLPAEIILMILRLVAVNMSPCELLRLLASAPVFYAFFRENSLWREQYAHMFDLFLRLHAMTQDPPGWARDWFAAFWETWAMEMCFAKVLLVSTFNHEHPRALDIMGARSRKAAWNLVSPYELRSVNGGEAHFFLNKSNVRMRIHHESANEFTSDVHNCIQTVQIKNTGMVVRLDARDKTHAFNRLNADWQLFDPYLVPAHKCVAGQYDDDEAERAMRPLALAGERDCVEGGGKYEPQEFFLGTTFGMSVILKNVQNDIALHMLRKYDRMHFCDSIQRNIRFYTSSPIRSKFQETAFIALALYYRLKSVTSNYFYVGIASKQKVVDINDDCADAWTADLLEGVIYEGKRRATSNRICAWAKVEEVHLPFAIRIALNAFSRLPYADALAQLETAMRPLLKGKLPAHIAYTL